MARSTWGLALDGARARILRDLEERLDGKPVPAEIALEIRRTHAADVMSDKPGRTQASSGTARSAMEYTSDPVEAAEHAFCDEVLDLLATHLDRGDFDRLVVAAPPRTLGFLRKRRPERLEKATVAEIAKDYLNLSAMEIRARLVELLPTRLV